MKTLNLKLAGVLIKIALFIEWILLIGAVVGIFSAFNNDGNTVVNIIKDYLPKFDQDLNEIIPTFKNTLPFYLLVIVEGTLLIYILKASLNVIKEFREGLVFNSKIAGKIKTIANWIVILVFTKIAMKFILQSLVFGFATLESLSGIGTIILFTTLIYVAADVIKKGADLKAENDLTI